MTAKLLMPLLLVALVSGCGRSTKDREAITHVLELRRDARQMSYSLVSNGGLLVKTETRQFDYRKYLTAIKDISTEGCPQDFREAWLNYVQTWTRFATPTVTEIQERRLRESATAGHFQIGAVNGAGSDRKNLTAAAQALENQDTGEAMRKVETVALKYGVEATRLETD